ncbi:MAG: AraC family transcriptional regulator [Gammaproteobacteria bacterium]|nr:MAG: AraC family transcriptional regulator [Gammaproteobacteria bacterium]
MEQQPPLTYTGKIDKVCQYISEHLNDDLSVEKLSQVAGFSKFHFHRQFTEFTGITVSKFILMSRLKQASYQLVYHPELKIIDIALAASFENPESFSRAFKKVFTVTPSQFRQKPQWQNWHEKLLQTKRQVKKIDKELLMNKDKNKDIHKTMNVEIITFAETKIAVLEHRGSPALLNNSISRFIEWRKSSGLSPVNRCNTYGIAYDDPATTVAKDFRFDICGVIKTEVPENTQGVITKTIPAGRCAKIRHLGSHEQMDDKIRALYSQWLPESGEELRDFPCFFHYINLFPQVEEHQLITDIYLPLK